MRGAWAGGRLGGGARRGEGVAAAWCGGGCCGGRLRPRTWQAATPHVRAHHPPRAATEGRA
eukprot:6930348-Prymnesium_polylepis.1